MMFTSGILVLELVVYRMNESVRRVSHNGTRYP